MHRPTCSFLRIPSLAHPIRSNSCRSEPKHLSHQSSFARNLTLFNNRLIRICELLFAPQITTSPTFAERQKLFPFCLEPNACATLRFPRKKLIPLGDSKFSSSYADGNSCRYSLVKSFFGDRKDEPENSTLTTERLVNKSYSTEIYAATKQWRPICLEIFDLTGSIDVIYRAFANDKAFVSDKRTHCLHTLGTIVLVRLALDRDIPFARTRFDLKLALWMHICYF